MNIWASLVAQTGKNPPTVQETWVLSLGQEDALEEGMATHSSILAWGIPMDRGAWRATVHGVTKSWTQLRGLAQHTGRQAQEEGCPPKSEHHEWRAGSRAQLPTPMPHLSSHSTEPSRPKKM